jgi:hypothetical protein
LNFINNEDILTMNDKPIKFKIWTSVYIFILNCYLSLRH